MKYGSASSKWISTLGIIGLIFTLTTIPSPVIMAQQAAADSQEVAKKSSDEDLPPLPLSPIEIAQKDGSALRLSLKDITKMALQNNLDIAIQDTNEELSQQKIIASYGTYDPTLRGTFGLDSSKSANTKLDEASATAAFSTSKNVTWSAIFSKNVKFSGGTLDANFNNTRQTTDQAFYTLNPNYNVRASVSYTQPLIKNFRIDSSRGNIKIVNLDLESTDSKFKQRVTETIANIQQQYWDLVSAIRDYDIKRNSVKLGQITLRDNKKKVDVGTLAPIAITEAQADLKSRELNLISSEEQILRQENTVRQLISNDRNADIWSKVIVPTDEPDFVEYKVDLKTAIDAALQKRPELEQYAIQLAQSDINLKMAANNRKWGMDLKTTFGSSGSAGTPTFENINRTIPEHIGGVGQAYDNLFTEGLINWAVQVSVNVPLGNKNTDSQIAQQKIQRQQTLMNRKNQEQNIQVEIRNAVQKLKTNRQQVETARMQTQLNKEQLDGEVKRFDAGLSENYRVLERQNSLAQAQNAELVNLINYKKSVIALQKAMYTLLESTEFEIAKGSADNVPDLK